jgi:prepilin-type N-terminal cleavage/methylation domain-containing protein
MLSRLNRRIRNLLANGRLPGFGREGFTLVEILMVLMILSIGILPIAVIQHRARDTVSDSDRHTQAIEVAQLHLERLKGLGFGNAAPENGVMGQITWAAAVTNVSFGMDRIDVTVNWSNDGIQESLVVSDLVSMR